MLGQVATLDVADEAQGRCVQELGGALDARVAFALLLPDAEERDPWVRDVEDLLGEDRAHPGVLGEVLGRRVRVGADVDEHERTRVGDHLDGESGTVDTGKPSQLEDPGGHARAGVPGGDDGVRLAVPDELGRDEDRRVLLLAHRERRVVLVHVDD